MTIRKKVAIGILLAVALGAFVCLAACGAGGPLDTPQNVRVEDETLIWDEVEGAEGYIVEIDGEAREVETNEVSMFTVMIEPRAYRVRVQAYGALDGPKDNSAWSETLSYTPQIAKSSGFGLRLTEDGMGYEIGAADSSVMQGKLVLPSAYGDKPIVGVVDNGFKDCTELTGVLIPSSIIGIGNYAFADCNNLTRVNCSPYAQIGRFAFWDCAALEQIQLPQSMEVLESSVFYGCSALEELTLPENLREIGMYTVYGCASLRSLEIPKTTEEIDPTAFGECSSLASLTVAEGNAVYYSESNCILRKEDKELVAGCAASVIPASAASIGEYAFSNCEGLTEITIPGNVKSVGENAFGFSSDLRAVHIEEGVEEIGGKNVGGGIFFKIGVFCGSALEELEIPASVRYLSDDLTMNCAELTSLTVAEGNAVYYSENNCILRKEDKEVVAGCKTSVIPQEASGIGAYAFAAIPVEEMDIPEGVAEIGQSAFRESALKVVSLPSTLKIIGGNAFSGCTGLIEVSIPYGVTEIGISAFRNTCLRYITIPESVKKIGASAFAGGYTYESDEALDINDPAELERIKHRLSVVLPGSVEEIGKGAFEQATIYTSAECGKDPEGWYRAVTGGDWGWYKECSLVKNCIFAYDDDGQPYVAAVPKLVEPNNMSYNFSLPYRAGYVFKGWATEEGGGVVYGITLVEPEEDDDWTPFYSALSKEDYYAIPPGTVLYAVWEKAE